MRFAFDDEQEEIRRTTRRFLGVHSSSARVRAAMLTTEGFDREVWRRLSAELGLTAIIVPAQYDGLGLSDVAVVGVMEEMGARLLCAPFFSTVCLGANALLAAGTEAQKQRTLPHIARGELTATLALDEAGADWDGLSIGSTASRTSDGYVLTGEKRLVVDGHTADLLVIAARAEGSRGQEGVSLFAVPGDADRLERTPVPTMDATRKMATVRLNRVRVSTAARLGEEGGGWSALQGVLHRAAIALAAEQVGGAQACLDMAVQYAKTRVQFGRPIGSFQAIKHKCADMLVRVESARSACYYAGWAAAEGDPELPVLASLAKSTCSDAYFHCAADNIQVHGGIGFTWEHDAHLYFKRARASSALLGSARAHRDRIAEAIGL